MISSEPSRLQPTRPTRKARKYSTTWKRGDAALRQADVEHLAAVDRAAVRDPDDAAGGDDQVGVVDDRLGDPQQRVLLEDRVGVDRADVGVARGVQAGVQRVRLAAVLLVDQPQLRLAARDVGAADGLGRERVAQRLADRDQVEGLDEPLDGRVRRAVVDDDDLVLGVAQREQRVDRLDDAGLLVVGGQQHRDRRGQRRRERLARRPRTGAPRRWRVIDAPGERGEARCR